MFILAKQYCDSQPCYNGATCQEDKESFKCQCGRGYTGTRCETGKIVICYLRYKYMYKLNVNKLLINRQACNMLIFMIK